MNRRGTQACGAESAHGLYPGQPHHEAKLNNVTVDEQKLGPPVLLILGWVSAGGRASKVPLASLIGKQDISQAAKEEKGICTEAVEEDDPVDHCSAKAKPRGKMRQKQRDNNMDKLVATVCDQIEELRGTANGEQKGASAYNENLQKGNRDCDSGRVTQQLWVEGAPQSSQQRREEDVGDEGHYGNVHVRRVDIFARRLIEQSGRGGSGIRGMALLAGPGAMPPWEEDDAQFGEDVRVCDIEVVPEGGDRNEASNLLQRVSLGPAIVMRAWHRK